MKTPDNKAVIRRYIDEVVGEGRLDLIDDLYAPTYRNHTNPPGLPDGPAGVRALIGAFRAAFPDVTIKTQQIVAEGDLVVWHTEASGTQTGELMGLPASGRRATWRAMSIDRLQNGRIVERWEIFDAAGLMAQINPPKA